MSQLDVPRVLESVANVAEHRDAKTLRVSLLQTLKELLPVRAAGFIAFGTSAHVDVDPLENDELPAFAAEIPADLLARVALGSDVQIPKAGGGGCIHLMPVGANEALAVHIAECTPDQLRTIDALARLYRNFTAMIRDSEQDRLTGLQNRRSFDSYLARVTEAALVAPEPVARDAARTRSGPVSGWLALFDLDHFKRINDRFGHLYGDEVLLLVAQMVSKLFRGEDRCFRYGGEEFAVILTRSDHDGVMIAMERLRQAISTHVFPQVGQVTVSVGCAPIEPGISMVEVIERADRALYQAKNAGRNRVVFYESGRDGRRNDRLDGNVELF
ncbi:GGDEF domain-containing protein [Sinimarinibacterium sp. CAU 1509]|uniref:GGDEF domain-containing protein n=1 Tax=Sinimarinibacterium sp. CAU 1509 TaxID=2562283 RepID=UPI0010AD9A9B|nr:GGDEF domain-containing protein [Sinimarinibacterium sp. CAU 1509]TJY58832.1 GGDEF domain-containing protein [Sinimarinibacterium sp. CAU 1509]